MRRSWLTALALFAGAWLLTASRCENTQTGPTTSTPTAMPAVTPTGGQTVTPTPTGPTPTATLTPTGTTATPTGSTTGTPTRTPTPSASLFGGNWTGQWKNDTAGTSGGATMTVNVNTSAQTFRVDFDLSGNVFGLADPPAQTFDGTYNSFGGSFTANSAFYGIVSFSINSAGGILGSLTNLPNPAVSRVDFSGTGAPQSITLSYIITFPTGSIATGTLTLTHT